MFTIVKNALRPRYTNNYFDTNKIMAVMHDILKKNEFVYIVYIDLINFEKVEDCHGDIYAQQFLLDFKKTILEEINKIYLEKVKMVDICHLWGDDYIVVLTSKYANEEDVCKLLSRLQCNIDNRYSTDMPSYFKDYMGIHVGFSTMTPPLKQIDKQYYKALKEAYKLSKKSSYCLPQHTVNEFHGILKNKNVESVFQPIISLDTGLNLGWEALTRGPKGSYFHAPSELFTFAEKSDSLFALEKITRELSIKKVGNILPNQKLFLNVNPTVMNDPEFSKGVTKQILKEYNLAPQQIVFEITERTSIKDFNTFRKTINHYRNQGYLVAVDDAGAGYSSLQTIAEIRPDFIKLDMSIIRNADKDSVKKALLETFVTFTQKINCQLIAEGIETASELSLITKLGVHYGQGYFIGKPSYPRAEPTGESITTIDLVSNKRLKENWFNQAIVAKDLLSNVPVVKEDILIEEIANMFELQPDVQGVVVLDRSDKPIGFLLKQALYKILVVRYGISLYYKKPVQDIMNVRPLIVQAETSIDVIAKLAMKRDTENLYDLIVVVNREHYVGSITIQKLLECLTQLKVEQARYANPLTGLAGNIMIENEIEQRLISKVNDVVMYIDIDYFKPYNDTYGFEQGDRFILLISKILKHAVKKNNETFLGHIGGDDFVIICNKSMTTSIAERIIKIFSRLMKNYYTKKDWQAQMLVSTDRYGRSCVYPLSTLSIAGVIIDEKVNGVVEVGERAAMMKKRVKNIAGNAFIIE